MGTILGTLLSCSCLGVFLLWSLPALFSFEGASQNFVLVASPLASLCYGLFKGLEAMQTNRCRGLILAAAIPAIHLSWVVQELSRQVSGSD